MPESEPGKLGVLESVSGARNAISASSGLFSKKESNIGPQS